MDTNIIKENTKTAFSDAMLELLKQYPYDKITVVKLCNKAGFVRKTFYNNFACKDDVIYFMLKSIYAQIDERIDLENMSIIKVLQICFSFILENKKNLIVFYRQDLFRFAWKSITKYITQENIISKIDKSYVNSHDYKYISAHIASSFISIIETWIENNFAESVEYMAELTEYLLNKPKVIQ